jgi:hypothetical protein
MLLLRRYASHDCSVANSLTFFKKAYSRMKTRRSKIASDVLTCVKTFFADSEFKNPDNVKEYIHWALKNGGPAYYSTPIPMECTQRDPHPDDPVSFFCMIGDLHSQSASETRWLLVLTVHIPNCQDIYELRSNVSSPSFSGTKEPTKGLVCDAHDRGMLSESLQLKNFDLTGRVQQVERAMRAHKKGVFNAPPDFNHQSVWTSMGDYYRILGRTSQSRWTQALKFEDDDIIENHADDSLLSAYRADFTFPSSPIKP